jgi:hypothetical protein
LANVLPSDETVCFSRSGFRRTEGQTPYRVRVIQIFHDIDGVPCVAQIVLKADIMSFKSKKLSWTHPAAAAENKDTAHRRLRLEKNLFAIPAPMPERATLRT